MHICSTILLSIRFAENIKKREAHIRMYIIIYIVFKKSAQKKMEESRRYIEKKTDYCWN